MPVQSSSDQTRPAVVCHESRPGRSVFTEDGNHDAWIATDTTVSLDP